MLKLSVKEGIDLPKGWKTVKISDAVDGEYNGTRYIDLHFGGMPENLKCRIWSAVNQDTGEDFGIGNLFYFANAGLVETHDGSLSIDDNANHLKGKALNIFFYENENGYTDAAQRVVPVVRDGFSETYVEKLKTRTEEWTNKRKQANAVTTTANAATTTTSDKAEVPF